MKINTLFVLIILFSRCSVSNKYPIVINSIVPEGEAAEISVHGFAGFGNYKFVSGERFYKKYKALLPQVVSVNRSPIYIIQPDTVNIHFKNSGIQIKLNNSFNSSYNAFINAVGDELASIRSPYPVYFYDHRDDIIRDAAFILKHITNDNDRVSAAIKAMGLKHEIPDSLIANCLFDELEINKIAMECFYTTAALQDQANKSVRDYRLKNFLHILEKFPAEIFLRNQMDVVISEIFLKLNGRAIFRNKTAADITAHIEWINNNLSKGSVPRHYLIANVYLQSKSAKIRLPAKTSKALKQEVASSVFKNSVSIQRYNAQSRERFDDKKEKNYYDVSGNSLTLKSILENYSGNPVLIDFGASWCLPCMQKIPEIEQYRKDFIDLNIVMISIEKSRDGWRKYLFDHKMENFSYYRVNSLNPDSLVKKIFEIPKYGFVNRNGSITILNEVNDSIIKNYIKTF